MFKSRNISADAFIKEFFGTLTPGVIPRSQFIDWIKIKEKCAKFSGVIEYFENLVADSPKDLKAEIRDTLLSADDPFELIKGSFELLGHTNDLYVSDQDYLEFRKAADEISKGSSKAAAYVSEILFDLGLNQILMNESVESTFMGAQIGLESHRRKSTGGQVFHEWSRRLLESTCALLGPEYELRNEERIPYVNAATAKKVDFAIVHKQKLRIGIEVNFFTIQGSKPSEIRRAYENVSRNLSGVHIDFVWITDGIGYLKMRRSLKEAFESHLNIYNFNTAQRYLKSDILDFLGASKKK
jgi:type II restriction enzyme